MIDYNREEYVMESNTTHYSISETKLCKESLSCGREGSRRSTSSMYWFTSRRTTLRTGEDEDEELRGMCRQDRY